MKTGEYAMYEELKNIKMNKCVMHIGQSERNSGSAW